jgi:hypothetical protein
MTLTLQAMMNFFQGSNSVQKEKPRFVTREEIQARAEQAKMKLLEKELKQCTFSPAINQRSLKMVENSRKCGSKTPNVGEMGSTLQKFAARTCPSKRPNRPWLDGGSDAADADIVSRRLELGDNNCVSLTQTPRKALCSRNPNLEARLKGQDANCSPCVSTPKAKVRHSIAFLADNKQVCVTIVDGEECPQTSNVARDRPVRLSLLDTGCGAGPYSAGPKVRARRASCMQPLVWTLDEKGKHVPVMTSLDKVWQDLPKPSQQQQQQQQHNRATNYSEEPIYPRAAPLSSRQAHRGEAETASHVAAADAETSCNAAAIESASASAYKLKSDSLQASSWNDELSIQHKGSGTTNRAHENQLASSSMEDTNIGVIEEETCTENAQASAPMPPPRSHKARVTFEDLNDETPIGVLRQFVEQEGLDVRAASKRALYVKICDYYSAKAGDSTLPDPSGSSDSKDHHVCASPQKTNDDEVSTMNELLDETAFFRSTMNERLEVLKAAAELWRSGDITGAIREASLAGDASVLSSLLDCSPPQLLDLDAFTALLQPAALPRLLRSPEEHHQVVLLSCTCHVLLPHD